MPSDFSNRIAKLAQTPEGRQSLYAAADLGKIMSGAITADASDGSDIPGFVPDNGSDPSSDGSVPSGPVVSLSPEDVQAIAQAIVGIMSESLPGPDVSDIPDDDSNGPDAEDLDDDSSDDGLDDDSDGLDDDDISAAIQSLMGNGDDEDDSE